ncbi:MAG: lysophospholipid acyltransferase family protein [Planctomycetota bacterium]|jgi:KDO2-lipid IV(A) lauroyltransferase
MMASGWTLDLILRCGRALPAPLAWRLGAALGDLFGRLPGRDQRRCREHLARAYPDRDPAWVARTARRSFRHFGRMTLWTLATLHRPPQALRRHVAWEGRKHLAALRAACQRNEGTLFVSGHLGNWELLSRVLGTIVPLSVLGKRMRNPEFDRIITELRSAHGNHTVYQDAGVRPCIAELRSGRVLGTLPDQDIPRLAGCFVPWFGHPAWTPIGPVTIAALGRVEVQGVYSFAHAGTWVLHISPRWRLDPTLPRNEAIAVLTARIMAYQEALVRRHPEQWVWWHKRWRTTPDQRPEALIVS